MALLDFSTVLTVELPIEMAEVLIERLLPKLILLTDIEVLESNALPGNLPAIFYYLFLNGDVGGVKSNLHDILCFLVLCFN